MRLAMVARRRSRPSLIPLIDVMLVLLFFFMLVTTYVETARTPLTLAAGGQGGAQKDAAGLQRVQLMDDGHLVVNGAALSFGEAVESLKSAEVVRLSPQPGVPLQALLVAWETLNRAGVKAELAEGAQ